MNLVINSLLVFGPIVATILISFNKSINAQFDELLEIQGYTQLQFILYLLILLLVFNMLSGLTKVKDMEKKFVDFIALYVCALTSAAGIASSIGYWINFHSTIPVIYLIKIQIIIFFCIWQSVKYPLIGFWPTNTGDE